jgi:transcriptional regulator with XRE-family HTH domain
MDPHVDMAKLRLALKSRGLKIGDFAARVGRHPSQMSRILNGRVKTQCEPETLEAIIAEATRLRIPVHEVASDAVNPRTREERFLLDAFRKLDSAGKVRTLALAADLASISGGLAFEARLRDEVHRMKARPTRQPDRAARRSRRSRRTRRAGG